MARTSCILGAAIVLFSACAHHDVPSDPDPSSRQQSGTWMVPIQAQVTAYIQTAYSPASGNVVTVNYRPTTLQFGGFVSDTLPSVGGALVELDGNNDYFSTTRWLPLGASTRAYCDLAPVRSREIGRLYDAGNAGSWTIPGGGSMSFSANTFTGSAQAGGEQALVATIDPSPDGALLTVPGQAETLSASTQYLKSYGYLYFQAPLPFRSGRTLRLTYPIAAGLQASAPDSVRAWRFQFGVWQDRGVARRSGATYIADIDSGGIWNFAQAVPGVRLTVKAKTDQGLPLVATPIRLRDGSGKELAALRTDINGTAWCIVPEGATIQSQILTNWTNQPSLVVNQQNLGTVSGGAATVTITVGATQPEFYSIAGTATSCGGTAISQGELTYREGNNYRSGFLPIRNGSFGAAFVSPGGQVASRFWVVDYGTPGVVPGDTCVYLNPGVNQLRLRACTPRKSVWAHFTIDGIPYRYDDLSTNLAATYVGWSDLSGNTTIAASSGLQFSVSGNGPATFTNSNASFSGLWVNNQSGTFEYAQPNKVNFTTYDYFTGMFVEGSVDFYYRDNTQALHHLVGDFRVRRT